MSPRICLVVSLAASVSLTIPAAAQAPPPGPTIQAATVDSGSATLTVVGTGLGTTAPDVALAGAALRVQSFDASSGTIVADLPGPIAAGTYQLKVTLHGGRAATFDLTIGAVGPQGPAGPQGPSTTDANVLFIGADQNGDEPGSQVQIGTDGVPRMSVLETGRVGIGTLAPQAALDVAGDVHLAGSTTTGGLVRILQTGPERAIEAHAPYGIGLFAEGQTAIWGNANYNQSSTGVRGDGKLVGVSGNSFSTTGATVGVSAQVSSPQGVAGLFSNLAGGALFRGVSQGLERFAVDGGGNVLATGVVTASRFVGDGSGLVNLPPGPQGPAGAPGPQGPVGPQGPAGVAFVRTIVISPVPGDPAQSGARLVAALEGIGDASEANPYLVWLEPGLYEPVGSVVMKPFVDISGSGQETTVVEGMVATSDHAELRNLTVREVADGAPGVALSVGRTSPRVSDVTVLTSGTAPAVAVDMSGPASPTFTGVTIRMTGTSIVNRAVSAYGGTGVLTFANVSIEVSGASQYNEGVVLTGLGSAVTLVMRDSRLAVFGPSSICCSPVGVSSYSDVLRLTNVAIDAGYIGVVHSGYGDGSVEIDRSTITGRARASLYYGGAATGRASVGASRLGGPVEGAWRCAGAYAGDFTALDAACH